MHFSNMGYKVNIRLICEIYRNKTCSRNTGRFVPFQKMEEKKVFLNNVINITMMETKIYTTDCHNITLSLSLSLTILSTC